MIAHPTPPRTPGVFELSAEDRKTLLQMFMREACEDLQRLEGALLEGDVDEATHRVHRLYGAALTVGATPLIAPLEDFEQFLRSARQIPPDNALRLMHLRQALHDYRQHAQPMA